MSWTYYALMLVEYIILLFLTVLKCVLPTTNFLHHNLYYDSSPQPIISAFIPLWWNFKKTTHKIIVFIPILSLHFQLGILRTYEISLKWINDAILLNRCQFLFCFFLCVFWLSFLKSVRMDEWETWSLIGPEQS